MMPNSCIAYLVQQHKGADISLAVLDRENQQFLMFPLSTEGIARLASECATALYEQHGGLNLKFATQEIVELLVKE